MRLPILLLVGLVTVGPGTAARAAPSPEVAKKCLAFSYRVYPFKRPGTVKGSNARRDYLADCMAKNGAVDEPPVPTAPAPTANAKHPAPKAN